MKKWYSIALDIVTATGDFLDAGTIATAGEAGAKFGLGLIWAVVLSTFAVILRVEMVGRFSSISKKPYAAAIRENFGFRFFLRRCAGFVTIRDPEWRGIRTMAQQDIQLSIRDLINSQLESADHFALGRVADVETVLQEDGSLFLTTLLTGPQALAGRVSPLMRTLVSSLFRHRFEGRIPLSEVVFLGPTLHLRKNAGEYQVGQSERWIARYILRWIPGSRHTS